MERNDVLKAWALCTTEHDDDFCPCDHCPMIEAGCDEYMGDDDFIPVSRALVKEIYKLLDMKKSEFTHVAFVKTVPRNRQ